MFTYIWPIALAVVSNIIYHICSKSIPGEANPFAPLTVAYLVGAVCTAVAFALTAKGSSIGAELGKLNWAPFALGVVMVGLEVGFLYAYKVGWQISMASLVQSTVLAVALIAVGALLYHEPLSRNKLIGVVICLVGLVFINL